VANDVIGPGQSIRYVSCKSDELVPGAYTKNGWRKVQPVLSSSDPWPPEGQVEPWVVADTRIPDDMERVRAQVRNEYFEQYARAWMSLLDKCAVSTPTDPGVCGSELDALSGPTGFYESLFLLFKDNAIKYEKKETLVSLLTQEGCSSKMPWSKADASVSQDPPSPVEQAFRPVLAFAGLAAPPPDAPKVEGPPPLQKYKEILRALIPFMETAGEQKAAEVKPQLRTAMQGLEGLLSSVEEPATKKRLADLLKPPISCASKVIINGTRGPISEQWRKQIWPPLQSLLERYPFNRAPSAHRDDPATFDAFAAFFRPPDGTLEAFVAGPLAEYVTSGAAGVPVDKPGYVVGEDLLSCLRVCQSITEAFFPRAEEQRGTKLAVLADWSAPDISDVKFTLGPKFMPLTKGDWSPTFKWAGEGARLSYTQSGTFQQISGRGSFSLFDLFDQLGGLKPTVPSNYLARSTTVPLTVKVRSESRQDPFGGDFFARLRCPAEIHPMVRQ
jgi:type VI protein secretion system component VasK